MLRNASLSSSRLPPAAARGRPGQDAARRGRARLRADCVRPRPAHHGRAASQDGGRLAHLLAEPGRFAACRRRITWKVPNGVSVGPIQWPAPHALPAGPLVNYGYEGEVLLLTDIHVAAERAVGAAARRSRPRPSGWSAARPASPRRRRSTSSCPSPSAPISTRSGRKAIAATRDALPRACPAGSSPPAAKAEGRPHADRPGRRGHARQRPLLPVPGGPHRAVGQADVRARRQRHVRADAAGRQPARRRDSRRSPA